MTYRPWVSWCRILTAVEGRGRAERMTAVGAAIRAVLDLPAGATWREVRWALCLDRRPVDVLCALFTAAYLDLVPDPVVVDLVRPCGTTCARRRHLARGETCTRCGANVELVAA